MDKRDLTEEVRRFAFQSGADLVGIAPVSRWKNAPEMLTPQAHLPEAQSVIAISIHHPDASIEWGGEPNSNYSGPFQLGMIPKLDTISWRMDRFLEQHGFTSIPFSCTGYWRHRPYKEITTTNTASFSHRHAFVAAGLGEFGWNNMVLSPKYGPRNRLVSVITSARLIPDPLYNGSVLCDRCGMCETKCPGNNFRQEHLLDPGFDEVKIEEREFRYAKLDRYRCLWGEQFALDMNELHNQENLSEEKIYEAIQKGVKRVGGEFGSCFRFCMAKPVRYWDKKYSSAPRRKKEKIQITPEKIIIHIKKLALDSGADRICIQPLINFSEVRGGFPEGYPREKFFKNFEWVITIGKTLPEFPNDDGVINDNKRYLHVTTNVRMDMGAMDIARYIDDLGFEATQDWTDINQNAAKFAGWNAETEGPARSASTGGNIAFDIIDKDSKRDKDKKEPIIIAGMSTEDKSITENVVISCSSVICHAPLRSCNKINLTFC